MITLKCDRCGDVITYANRCEVTTRYPDQWPLRRFDLCKTCLGGLIDIFMHELDEAKGSDNDA